MTIGSYMAYALALIVAVATPGPAMLAVIGRSLSHGFRPAMMLTAGIAIADVMLGSLALAGLAALMAAYAWLFEVVKYGGAAYLLWLGVRMWRAPVDTSRQEPQLGRKGLAAGMAIALANPKAILFHASLMPLILDIGSLDWRATAAILSMIFCVNLIVMGGYAFLAGRGSGWFTAPSRQRWLNRLGGGSMVGAGAIAAAR